jgi:hypothetical protein
MWLVELIAIIIGIIYVRKQKLGLFFLLYLGFDFLVLNVDIFLISFLERTDKLTFKFVVVGNSLVSAVEFFIYNYFFYKVIRDKRIRFVLKVTSISFFLFLLIALFNIQFGLPWRTGYSTKILSSIGFIFLLIPCAAFYYEIMNIKSRISLQDRPSFWITTGIFFYAVISIPYYLVDMYFLKARYEYRVALSIALFIIPFLINFLFLIKAFLCKRSLTI